jgi:hypothetical protein
VALHVESLAPESVVTKEARKGYDFLMIGVERTTAAHGGFHEQKSWSLSVENQAIGGFLQLHEDFARPVT